MKTYTTYSENQTKKLAQDLAKDFTHGVIALSGVLGVGKTTFVQGFAKGLGIKEKIISPTFVLIRQHKIPNSKRVLYHVDLYRLAGNQIANSLGLEDLMSNLTSVVLIEWAEKVKDLLPKNTIWISFKTLNENHGSSNKREITL